MKDQLIVFAIRWCATSFGIWLSVKLLGGVAPGAEPSLFSYIGAGLAFSIINSLLKPIITIFSLPAVVLTLGLFMLLINGLMVYIALLLVPSIDMSFWQAVLAGIILSIINYIISEILDYHQSNKVKRSA